MRIIYPTVTSMGLGNNIITLAKAHVIAETCHLAYQRPIWPPCEHVKPYTPNGYGYYFPTTTQDALKMLGYTLLPRLKRGLGIELQPTLTFSREDYAATGIEDIGEACEVYLKARGLDDPSKSLLLTTTGMWGGYRAIRRARGWIQDLFLSHNSTREQLDEILRRTADSPMRVCVQIRMGDFVARENAGTIKPGERVVRLPLEWYARICRQIRGLTDCTFILVTDGTYDELRDFITEFEPVHIIGQPYQDLLGALLISHSDLVVCSNSTYSRLGCFLNDKPYIWPADTLYPDDTGQYGYLWEKQGQPVPNGRTADPDAVRRCFALHVDFTSLPIGLRRYLEMGGKAAVEIADDLMYDSPVYLFN